MASGVSLASIAALASGAALAGAAALARGVSFASGAALASVAVLARSAALARSVVLVRGAALARCASARVDTNLPGCLQSGILAPAMMQRSFGCLQTAAYWCVAAVSAAALMSLPPGLRQPMATANMPEHTPPLLSWPKSSWENEEA